MPLEGITTENTENTEAQAAWEGEGKEGIIS